jgi:hypothetical protein
MEDKTMTSPEERMSIGFLNYLYEKYGENRHIKRLAPSIGPLVYKIYNISQEKYKGHARQIRFGYKGRWFKARYSHEDGGRLEIVEFKGKQDVKIAVKIRNLSEAMKLDLNSVLDNYLQNCES